MKAIVYYTCNTHKPEIDRLCREQLKKIDLPIISVSLNKDIDFGNTSLRIDGKREPLMLHRQALMGLEACQADHVFLAESDVLYHPTHFDFTPAKNDVFYCNTNVWKLRWSDGHCVWTDDLQQLSGMSGSRDWFFNFFKQRVAEIERNGFNRHYEPKGYLKENYQSEFPNICIRHDTNITLSKWSIDDFRNKKYAKGWKETSMDNIPGWNLREVLGR